MVGFIARFPGAFLNEVTSRQSAGNGTLIMILLEIVLWFAVIVASIYLVTAVRRISVQYAKRTVVGAIKTVGSARDYIPLRLNASGVMPIIFVKH